MTRHINPKMPKPTPEQLKANEEQEKLRKQAHIKELKISLIHDIRTIMHLESHIIENKPLKDDQPMFLVYSQHEEMKNKILDLITGTINVLKKMGLSQNDIKELVNYACSMKWTSFKDEMMLVMDEEMTK